jgi:transcriptional regulator with XRE-family HTH domain
MSTTLRETIARMPRDQQEEIAAETARLRAEVLTLRDLRKARELTQVQLAETLGQSQVSIAKLERRSDLLLSTLRRYVEAMGGRLDLVVQFPDRPPVRLGALGEIDGDAEPTPRDAAGRAA